MFTKTFTYIYLEYDRSYPVLVMLLYKDEKSYSGPNVTSFTALFCSSLILPPLS